MIQKCFPQNSQPQFADFTAVCKNGSRNERITLYLYIPQLLFAKQLSGYVEDILSIWFPQRLQYAKITFILEKWENTADEKKTLLTN